LILAQSRRLGALSKSTPSGAGGEGLLDVGEQLLGIAQVVRGAGAVGREVVQGGAGVLAGVRQLARLHQGQGEVEAGLAGSVEVVRGFPEADGLAVVGQGAVDVAGVAVNLAERVVGDRQVVDRGLREQLERPLGKGEKESGKAEKGTLPF
jgi:hypothetical protein